MPKTMVCWLLALAVLGVPLAQAVALPAAEAPPQVDDAAVNARIDARLHSVLQDLAERSRASSTTLGVAVR